MPLPVPAPGLLIAYSYLWHDQHRAGAEEGRKTRPCAIVIATRDDDGETKVFVAPVTHAKPADPYAVALPASVKKRLGLDADASWIVTAELNQFVWPGYDLHPVRRDAPGTYAWGYLPVEILEAVKSGILANRRANRLKLIPRA